MTCFEAFSTTPSRCMPLVSTTDLIIDKEKLELDILFKKTVRPSKSYMQNFDAN